jgi:hypothetical protein
MGASGFDFRKRGGVIFRSDERLKFRSPRLSSSNIEPKITDFTKRAAASTQIYKMQNKSEPVQTDPKNEMHLANRIRTNSYNISQRSPLPKYPQEDSPSPQVAPPRNYREQVTSQNTNTNQGVNIDHLWTRRESQI